MNDSNPTPLVCQSTGEVFPEYIICPVTGEWYPPEIRCGALDLFNAPTPGVGGVKALPCLFSNNTPEPTEPTSEGKNDGKQNLLTPYHRKAAHALRENVSDFMDRVGVERVGFLTLTFPDNVTDHKEAYKRFDSMRKNFLNQHPMFGDWICVKERQKRGAWHYHLLIDCGTDIRSGLKWKNRKPVYSTVSPALRTLWSELREALPKYKFGRSELLPVRKDAESVSKYLGKYISKHIGCRKNQDKGVRLVSYSKGWPRSNANFQWFTDNSFLWRSQVGKFAEYYGCLNLDDLKNKFGRSWAYHLGEYIVNGSWTEKLAEKTKVKELKFKVKELFGGFKFSFRINEQQEFVNVKEEPEGKKRLYQYKNPHLFIPSVERVY